MRTMILAFNPSHIKQEDIEKLARQILEDHKCFIYFIAHFNNQFEPLYCVQFTDTENKK